MLGIPAGKKLAAAVIGVRLGVGDVAPSEAEATIVPILPQLRPTRPSGRTAVIDKIPPGATGFAAVFRGEANHLP
jgi:hypothetical protein